MRCKKHPTDLTCTVGVCSSCLRERLTALIEAQTQAHAQAQVQAQLSRLRSFTAEEVPRKSDPNPKLPHPPPLIFPRSVSPYVSRRKSDDSTWHHHHRPDHHQHHDRHQHRIRFYSTPQVGPTYGGTTTTTTGGSYKKNRAKFSLLSSLFRSRSEKYCSDPRVSSRDSLHTSSPSWFSTIFAGKRGKQQSKQLSGDESSGGVRRPRHRFDRGMSPDLTPDAGGGALDDDCDRSPSGSGDSSASPLDWKRTPAQATPSARRTRGGQGKNVSGLAFCLSPLVRASPNPHWNQKGFPPDLGIAGDIRVAAKPHLSTAASFCKNRSRKLADFGRANPNR